VRWTEKNTRYLPETFERDNPDLIIQGNELVINLTAQSLHDEFLGRVCLTSSGERCLLNQRLARLTPAAGVRKFFLYVFKSSRFRRFVDGLNSGSLIQHIFTSQLGNFSLPFPPESEQIMIVEEIDRRLAAAERLRDTLVNQLARTREVRNAVLRDALAGRLVTSQPDAESAAKLLTDLHESVKLQPAKRGRTSMPKTKSSTKVTHPISLLATLKDHTDGMTPEQLFAAAGHTQDSIDRFFAELRELTAPPAAIVEERTTDGVTILRAAR
jgi:type I restriction enzyme S subunit